MKCCDITAGKMRTPITVQRKTRTANGTGGFTESWATLSGASTRAYVVALSGAERLASDRVEASARFRVTCRYFSGLKESDRIQIAGRAHNIRFINNVEMRNKWYAIDVDGGAAT